MMRVLSLLGEIRSDRRGAAIIEMAIVAPIFATMLVGMVDIGRGYSVKLQLEQAAQRSIEKVMNGQADRSTADALKTEAATTAVVPAADVVVDFWLECDSARQGSYESSCSAGAISRRYLTVEIRKTYTPMFAFRWPGSNSDGNYIILGKTGIRTQ